MFSTSGSRAAVNLARQRSAVLATGTAAPPPSAADAGAAVGAAMPAAGSGGAPPNTHDDAGVSMPDAGMSAPPSDPPGPIPCITLECQRDRGQYCCLADDRGSRATCETETKSCASSLRCTSDSECGHGQICCVNSAKASQCRAAVSCDADDKHLACDSAGPPARVCTHQVDCPMPGSCVRSTVLPTLGFCL